MTFLKQMMLFIYLSRRLCCFSISFFPVFNLPVCQFSHVVFIGLPSSNSLLFVRYCQLCEVLLEEDFITAEKFAIDFLPHLLTYQTDDIVNVKLALSRTLTRAVMVTGRCAYWNLTHWAPQILSVSSRCSLTISVRVQQLHTAQKLTILIQNYYKVLQNLLCLQKLYYA
jgi:hypothetical protein